MTDVHIALTNAEALVLFEWLSRLDAMEPAPFADVSEQTVAWRMQAQLESVLREPFAPNYKEVLARARREVQGSVE